MTRQYDSRLDRRLDVTGDLTRAEAEINAERGFQRGLWEFAQRNLPSQEEYLERAAAKYRARLEMYQDKQGMIQG